MTDEQATPAREPMTNAAPHATKADVSDLLARHGDVLWRFVLARVRSHDAAEDIVQETVLAAIGARDRFTGASSDRTWLLSIASHKVADHFRARRRSSAQPLTPSSEPTTKPSVFGTMFTENGRWATLPDDWARYLRGSVEHAELLGTLRACMQQLPPTLAEVVMLRELLQLSTNDICKDMEITPTNLWSRMHRARAALRSCIEKAFRDTH
jgi:RNA polymerase sigma-70 factor (ECF subfamily)